MGRLPDRVTIGVLTRCFPPSLVDEVLAETGRREQRSRLLPARLVVYFVLAMCVFASHGYEEVMRLLTAGLAGDRRWRVPTTAAIWRARERLGVEPMRLLFDRTAGPVAAPGTAGSFYRRWRLAAVDGTTLDLPDTPANAEFFGRPGTGRGDKTAAFPQARVVLMVECGTRAVLDAVVGTQSTHETTLARDLFPGLGPDTLLLADRGFGGHDLWRSARAGGADLLWRVRSNQVFPLLEDLPDGSYRSALFPGPRHTGPALPVRVIEYTLEGTDTIYRLITSILDPVEAPATELAALYARRWEIETALDEIKTHQRGPGHLLRSRYPVGVEQEIYGLLLVHHGIRALIYDAAAPTGTDPSRGSFSRTLHLVRRQVIDQAGLSPQHTRPSLVQGPRRDH